ncbi:hypothetical protein QP168_09095, partial [Aerococcus urinae]|uniref:hypothetical protein n=1 Tax=Aerococcus urinae TaxID=1376 RepID=UPI00254E3A80
TVSNKKELAKGQLTIYKVQLIGVTIRLRFFALAILELFLMLCFRYHLNSAWVYVIMKGELFID